MKRGKRVLENDNMFIYVGTAIFILLAVALGIIMYMTTKTGSKIENSEPISKQVQDNTETVTSEIGKSVEDQEKSNSLDSDDGEKPNKVIETKEENIKKTDTPVVKTDINSDSNIKTQTEVTETKTEITFIKPTDGDVIFGFAKDNLIYSETLKEWITHTAVDIKADKTSVIKSAADGVIKSIINDPRYGLTVVITHDDGYETVYSNLLTAEFVVVGEEVTQGQTIGTAGNTAAFESNIECHVHFELLKDGEYLDPTIYLK